PARHSPHHDASPRDLSQKADKDYDFKSAIRGRSWLIPLLSYTTNSDSEMSWIRMNLRHCGREPRSRRQWTLSIGPIADIGRGRCALHDAESALAANMRSYMRSRNAIHVNDVVSIGSDV